MRSALNPLTPHRRATAHFPQESKEVLTAGRVIEGLTGREAPESRDRPVDPCGLPPADELVEHRLDFGRREVVPGLGIRSAQPHLLGQRTAGIGALLDDDLGIGNDRGDRGQEALQSALQIRLDRQPVALERHPAEEDPAVDPCLLFFFLLLLSSSSSSSSSRSACSHHSPSSTRSSTGSRAAWSSGRATAVASSARHSRIGSRSELTRMGKAMACPYQVAS